MIETCIQFIRGGWKFDKAATTINISDAIGANEIGIFWGKNASF